MSRIEAVSIAAGGREPPRNPDLGARQENLQGRVGRHYIQTNRRRGTISPKNKDLNDIIWVLEGQAITGLQLVQKGKTPQTRIRRSSSAVWLAQPILETQATQPDHAPGRPTRTTGHAQILCSHLLPKNGQRPDHQNVPGRHIRRQIYAHTALLLAHFTLVYCALRFEQGIWALETALWGGRLHNP